MDIIHLVGVHEMVRLSIYNGHRTKSPPNEDDRQSNVKVEYPVNWEPFRAESSCPASHERAERQDEQETGGGEKSMRDHELLMGSERS